MKTLNRTLSLALVFALVFSLMSFAFAADTTTTTTTTTTPTTTTTTTTPTTTAAAPTAAFTDQASIKHTDAVNSMVALNVINGYEDGSFKPAENVTRGQMCKMICILLNSGAVPTLSTKATPTYTDIKGHWAESYIEYCSKLGIVAGMGDGTFAPDATVTVGQAAKMLLVALGYTSENEGFTGANWLLAVNVRANQKGLYKDMTLDTAATLDRDNAAQMISNGAFANEVEYEYKIVTNNGTVTTTATVKDKTKLEGNNTVPVQLVEDKYNLEDSIGTFTNETYNSVTKNYVITLRGYNSNTDFYFDSAVDYSKFYGMQVRLFSSYDRTTSKNNVYGVAAYKSSIVASGIMGLIGEDFLKAVSNGATEFTSNGTTYNFETSSTIATTPISDFNRSSTGFSTIADRIAATATALSVSTASATAIVAKTLIGENYEFIDNNNNGKIDMIVVYPYSVYKMTYVGTSSATYVNPVTKASGSIDNLNNVATYTGMAKGDYVKMVPAANNVSNKDTYTKITTLEAPVASTSTATVSGTPVTKVQLGTQWLMNGSTTDMKSGYTYSDIAQVNGVIYDATESKSTISAKDYALLTWAGNPMGGNQAKLVFSDGTIKLVETDINYNTVRYTSKANADSSTPAAGGLWTSAPVLVSAKLSSSTNTYKLLSATLTNADSFDKAVSETATANDTTSTANGPYVYSASGSKLYKDAIDDAAIIFAAVKKSGNVVGYKVITGAQLKALPNKSVLNVYNVYAMTNKTTGFDSVALAYIDIDANATAAAESYGYVTAVGTTTNTDKSIVTSITVWTGSELKTLACDQNYTNASTLFPVHSAISYTVNADGSYTPKAAVTTSAAITAYDSTTGKITLSPAAAAKTVDTTGAKTAIIYIDSSTGDYKQGGSIQLATKDANGNIVANNCRYVDYDADHDLKLIIVDTKANTIDTVTTINATTLGHVVTVADVNTALTSNSNVKVTTAITDASAQIEVPDGKVLTIAATDGASITYKVGTGAQLIAKSGILGTITSNAGTVDVTGAIVTVTSNDGTITASAGITTVSANAGTINATTISSLTNSGTVNASGLIGNVVNNTNGATINATAATSAITTVAANAGTISAPNGAIGTVTTNTGKITAKGFSTAINGNDKNGEIHSTGAIVKIAATADGVIYIDDDLTVTDVDDTLTGKIVVAAGKTLTITNDTNVATLQRIFGAADGAKLMLGADSSGSAYTTTTGNADAASYSGNTSPAAITATTAGHPFVYAKTGFVWTRA